MTLNEAQEILAEVGQLLDDGDPGWQPVEERGRAGKPVVPIFAPPCRRSSYPAALRSSNPPPGPGDSF